MSTSFKERKPPTDAEIREYFLVLRDDPASRVFAPLAEALIRRGRLDEAEQLCRLGLEHHPDFSDGHLAYARVLFYRFRHREALEQIKLALGLDDRNVEAYLIAAEIFLAAAQPKAAADACMRALDLEPDNDEALRLLQRTGAGPAPAAGAEPRRFKSRSGTAPSRRRQAAAAAPPAPDNAFQDLLAAVEAQQAPPPAAEPPRLPDHPPPEPPAEPPAEPPLDDLLAQVPRSEAAAAEAPQPAPQAPQPAPQVPQPAPQAPPPAPQAPQQAPAAPSAPPAPGLARVEAAQRVIDAYRGHAVRDRDDDARLRVPRGRGLLALFGLLALLAGAVALLLLAGIADSRRPAGPAATAEAGDRPGAAGQRPAGGADEP